MKRKMLFLIFIVMFLSTPKTFSASIAEDVNSLGTSEEILKKAKEISPDHQIHVVQKRYVDRNYRFEIDALYGAMTGTGAYLSSDQKTVNLEFHLHPKFSMGARYSNYGNRLSNEGQSAYEEAYTRRVQGDKSYQFPKIDYPIESTLVSISYYPVNGKLNLFDKAVSHFDLYLQGGIGKMKTQELESQSLSAAFGSGFWFSDHLTARLELRYQSYFEKVSTEPRRVDAIIGAFGIGFLL